MIERNVDLENRNSCVVTVLSVKEMVRYCDDMERIASSETFCADAYIAYLIDFETISPEIETPAGWELADARRIVSGQYYDKSFILEHDEFISTICICSLYACIRQFENVMFVYPEYFAQAEMLFEIDIAENAIVLPSYDATPNSDASRRGHRSYLGLMIFSRGEGVEAFLAWCEHKIDFVLNYCGSFPAAPDVDLEFVSQWDFFSNWIDFASIFPLKIFSENLRLPSGGSEVGDPPPYPYDKFQNGVPISRILRQNYMRNYRLRRKCQGDPFGSANILLGNSVVLGDTFPVPFTPVMKEIYLSRADLQTVFGELSGYWARRSYTEWFLNHRDIDADLVKLDDAYFTQVGQAYHQFMEKEAAEKPNRLARRLHRKKDQTPAVSLPKGVNLCGYINGEYGLGESLRTLADALDIAGIPFTIVEHRIGRASHSDLKWDHKVSNEFIYDTNLIGVNIDEIGLFMQGADPSVFRQRYNIGYLFWEIAKLPENWVPELKLLDEIWTASNFLTEIFSTYTKTPVRTIPLAVDAKIDTSLTRTDFGIEEDAFLFLMNYDPHSGEARKNPKAAIQAFRKAFSGDERVRLVIKANTYGKSGEEVKLIHELANDPNIDLILETFAKEKVNALIHCCDALVSLHRAEGFGLVPAEAMYFGKPVILTNWSGNTEYMTPENCCPVGYKMMPIGEGDPVYPANGEWADPDVEQAAEYMRRLASDPEYYSEISRNAKETIHTRFSKEAIADKIQQRLQELNLL
ncbi:hypothetical protein AGMMS49983_09230 [Clostridia bacterium]|nr:hypothetical protein AGMMS49983_09230 [Clostridia bacterium]